MAMKPALSRSILVLAVALAAMPLTAGAANGYSLFGDAQLVSPGHASPTGVQMRSSTTIAPNYGGIDFSVPSGTTFGSMSNLGTDYMFTAGSCADGSPRFQINVDGVNAFVYIGPPPNYTGCPMNIWQTTGNLATPNGFVDTSQLPGGTFYDTFVAANVKYGTHAVTGIQLVIDGGYAFPLTGQTVVVDNVMINDTTYTFESKQSCKDGGWENFTSAPGPFKNQGQCVSFFASGDKN
jgi:hypothetical protein